MAFARVWGFCASRFDHLPAKTLDRAQQRLAALLVLVALSSESATRAAEQIASNEIVDLVCTTDLLLTDCRVLDLRELARRNDEAVR
jgi:hypothetical protein